MGSGTAWFGGEWSLVQAQESTLLVFNVEQDLQQVDVGVPHHAALTGVTGPALAGNDSNTPFGIPVPGLLRSLFPWHRLEQLMEPTQPQHHPGTGLYWEHWEGAVAMWDGGKG